MGGEDANTFSSQCCGHCRLELTRSEVGSTWKTILDEAGCCSPVFSDLGRKNSCGFFFIVEAAALALAACASLTDLIKLFDTQNLPSTVVAGASPPLDGGGTLSAVSRIANISLRKRCWPCRCRLFATIPDNKKGCDDYQL